MDHGCESLGEYLEVAGEIAQTEICGERLQTNTMKDESL